MPPVPPQFLDAIVFLYPTQESALKGDRAGGTGFVVGYPVPGLPTGHFFSYVVTAKHVIEKSRFVRVNCLDGDVDVAEFPMDGWTCSLDDDLAVFRMWIDPSVHRHEIIQLQWLMTQQMIDVNHLGIGDDLYMVGRYVKYDGGADINLPVVRFGHVSMMPERPIPMANGAAQTGYLAEFASQPGFSGSPVFLYGSPDRLHHATGSPVITGKHIGPLLFGMFVGGYMADEQVKDRDGKSTDYRVAVNPHMAVIVPASRIAALLESDEVKTERDQQAILEVEKFQRADGADPMSSEPDTQLTARGLEIAVPDKDQVMADFKKIVKPKE